MSCLFIAWCLITLCRKLFMYALRISYVWSRFYQTTSPVTRLGKLNEIWHWPTQCSGHMNKNTQTYLLVLSFCHFNDHALTCHRIRWRRKVVESIRNIVYRVQMIHVLNFWKYFSNENIYYMKHDCIMCTNITGFTISLIIIYGILFIFILYKAFSILCVLFSISWYCQKLHEIKMKLILSS